MTEQEILPASKENRSQKPGNKAEGHPQESHIHLEMPVWQGSSLIVTINSEKLNFDELSARAEILMARLIVTWKELHGIRASQASKPAKLPASELPEKRGYIT